EAAKFYVSLFKDGRIKAVSHHGESTSNPSGQPAGAVLTVVFEIAGHEVMLLNGGGDLKLNEAASLVIHCDTQAEIDRLYVALTADGGKPGRCGWLTDRFGLTWQLVPAKLGEWITQRGPAAAQRVFVEIMKMQKLDMATLEKAAQG
ncbi:MAG: VOC family protein, partial [Planctomycetota bacterium]